MNDRPKYRTTNFKIYSQNITNINVDEDRMTISTIFCEYSYQTSLKGLLTNSNSLWDISTHIFS